MQQAAAATSSHGSRRPLGVASGEVRRLQGHYFCHSAVMSAQLLPDVVHQAPLLNQCASACCAPQGRTLATRSLGESLNGHVGHFLESRRGGWRQPVPAATAVSVLCVAGSCWTALRIRCELLRMELNRGGARMGGPFRLGQDPDDLDSIHGRFLSAHICYRDRLPNMLMSNQEKSLI